MNVKIMKLMNGEEIIADVESGEDDKIILSSPAKIALFPSEEGGMGMALMPWFPYSDEEKATIREKDILVTISPSGEILDEYNSRFGSGLITPSSDIII